MSDEQDRESGGTPPPASGTPGPWLPPRLRDRLAGADDPPPRGDSPIVGILVFVVIAAMVGGLFYWKTRQIAAEKQVDAKKAAAEAAAAVADSLDRVRVIDSLRTAARADSVQAFLALPPWKRLQMIASKGDTSKVAHVAAEESGHYVIDAGTFLFEEPAQAAMATIKAGTKLEVRVAPVESGGSTSYHVYVGNFRQRGEATYTANQLFEKGTLPQANVVKLDR